MIAITRSCRWLAAVAMLGGAMAAGCGPTRPALYTIHGRAVDANTRQGVGQANLVLRALVVRLGGVVETRATTTLVAYGVTGMDGTFEMELSEGFDVIRQARQIRLEAVKNGYALAIMDIPPPTRKEESYKVQDILMMHSDVVPWGGK